MRRSVVDVGAQTVARETTQTGKSRRVPVMGCGPAFGAALIEKYELYEQELPWDIEATARRHRDDILFHALGRSRGGYITTAALNRLVERAGKRIGVEGLSASDLRHCAATNLVTMTKDLAVAAEVLGHTAKTMTLEHYDRATDGRLDAATAAGLHSGLTQRNSMSTSLAPAA